MITTVLCGQTGDALDYKAVIGTHLVDLHEQRDRARKGAIRGEPAFRCARCSEPVLIRGGVIPNRFHFAHYGNHPACPFQTGQSLTQDEINARKYNGAKTSVLHHQMEAWLVESMRVDGRFTDIHCERVVSAAPGVWRKPDVQCRFNGQPIAFEIQLSTTFHDVVVRRRLFYEAQGWLLVWVFARFHPQHRRLMDDDIFYANNENAFVVGPRTVEASREQGRLVLECSWSTHLPGQSPALDRQLVAFDALVLDPQKQEAYFVDVRGLRAADRNRRAEELRAEIEARWGEDHFRCEQHWGQKFSQRLAEFGVPPHEQLGHTGRILLTALYSSRHNRPWGQGNEFLISVVHQYFAQPGVTKWFAHALRCHGRFGSLRKEGSDKLVDGKLLSSFDAKMHRTLTHYGQPEHADGLATPEAYRPLIEFLFPELGRLPFVEAVGAPDEDPDDEWEWDSE